MWCHVRQRSEVVDNASIVDKNLNRPKPRRHNRNGLPYGVCVRDIDLDGQPSDSERADNLIRRVLGGVVALSESIVLLTPKRLGVNVSDSNVMSGFRERDGDRSANPS
jgi:hypothetical protein